MIFSEYFQWKPLVDKVLACQYIKCNFQPYGCNPWVICDNITFKCGKH